MVNLLDYNRQGLAHWLASIGEASYRADQLFKWIHYYGVDDFAQMTNLSKSLRARLQEIAVIKPLTVMDEQRSSDGTIKWLFKLDCGNAIETVFIPEEGRGTLCISSQIGCALNCSFCSTARQGFSRNLSVGEVIGQVYTAVRFLSDNGTQHDRQVTNVVMMGMGEPLLNFDAVVAAMDIMLDDLAYGLAKRRVTLSTSGVVPEMWRLREASNVALAVSLHAPDDELRNILVPLNKKYPLAELMAVCKNYYKNEPRRSVTFEYVMLAGINDQPKHAKAMVRLLEGIPAKINLIPFNPFPQAEFKCSAPEVIEQFRLRLKRSGLVATARKTRGDDIDAACGQLAGQVSSNNKANRQHHIAAKLRKVPIVQAQLQDKGHGSATEGRI